MRIVVCALSDDGKNNVVGERPGKFTTANIGEKLWVAETRIYSRTRGSAGTRAVHTVVVTVVEQLPVPPS